MKSKYAWWLVHGAIWVSIGVFFSLPQYDWTVGVFHSGDGSVIVPTFYGVIINATLFYGNAYFLMPLLLAKKKRLKYWISLIGGFLGLTLLEIIFDAGWYVNFYNTLNKDVLNEIVISNVFLNAFFFLLPSLFYRFALDWVKLNNVSNERGKTPVKNDDEVISIKVGKTIHKLALKNIEFIESEGNNVIYHHEGEKISVRDSLANLNHQLPDETFVRCHKSFIVSKLHVKKIDYEFVYLSSQQVPIGRAFRENVNRSLH